MEDRFIIEQMRKKSSVSADAFIRKYGKLIYGVLNKILITSYEKNEIEGVFYEVVMKIYNNIECYDEEKGKFSNFIISVSKYAAIDELRKLRGKQTLELKEEILNNETCEDNYNISDEKEDFVKLLDGLKDIDKDIFIRKYYLEQKADRIAKDLGVTEDYVYTRLSRGRKKLKSTLGGGLYGRESIV